jgi:hypothetical protein
LTLRFWRGLSSNVDAGGIARGSREGQRGTGPLALAYVKLGEALMESAVPPDIGPLLRDFANSLERTTRALDLAIARLIALDERLARSRAEVREAVLRDGEVWPLPFPR